MTEAITEASETLGPGHVRQLCEAVGLPHATCYRLRRSTCRQRRGDAPRSQIQKIALRSAHAAELYCRGMRVNHKRVLRLMREDNLLAVRKKRFVKTTDSRHGLPVYPNLAARMEVSRMNQLWVADLTYIRLRRAFVYLAVVLDAFSRRVIGWALGRSLEASLTVEALWQALSGRRRAGVAEGALVHHPDRGVLLYQRRLY